MYKRLPLNNLNIITLAVDNMPALFRFTFTFSQLIWASESWCYMLRCQAKGFLLRRITAYVSYLISFYLENSSPSSLISLVLPLLLLSLSSTLSSSITIGIVSSIRTNSQTLENEGHFDFGPNTCQNRSHFTEYLR